jgi:outer membrane protein assembly factor BamB
MNRTLTTALITTLLTPAAMLGQNLGDQATAGFTDSRTYLNSDAGDFKPPLELARTLDLPEGTSAQRLSIFERYFLYGEGGAAAHYTLLDRETDSAVWRFDLPTVAPDVLNYAPAINGSIVLLGGSTTTSVTAVEVFSGNILWQDDRVGSSDGRLPLLLDDLALYSGQWGVVAARPADGSLVWQYPPIAEMGDLELAKAPVSSLGSRVYVLEEDGALRALDLLTGVPVWSAPEVGSDGSNVIATRKYVYVNNRADGSVNAVRTSDGSVAWSVEFGESFGNPGIALAYGQLFVFSGTGSPHITTIISALDSETGTLRWESVDSEFIDISVGPPALPQPPRFGQIANNLVYFYNPWTRRVRVLDAFSGNVCWSISQDAGVQGLAVANDAMFVLLADGVEVYETRNTIFLAQYADGFGASTPITLANPSSESSTGTVEFFDDDGNPALVRVEDLVGPVSSLEFELEPNGTLGIQTSGATPPLIKGWARVTASRPTRGTAVYQVRKSDDVLFEAGVGGVQPTGLASVFVSNLSGTERVKISTAIALANPLDEQATVHLTFRFEPRRADDLRTSVTLKPGEHLAQFVDEFLPDLADLEAVGTLIIRSEVPVVVTALRTQNGFPMSSYPVGIP